MSGGVDSALAARLALDTGARVEGIFMKNWDEDDGSEWCTAIEDHASASAACEVLGIPLHRVSFSPEYWDQVFAPMVEAYGEGLTPNPDVACNRHIKFGALKRHATALGFDWLATGHYARIGAGADGPELLRATDLDKDQSYFLHGVTAQALDKVLFPIGHLKRAEVRQLARQAGLPNWNRRGSTGICFIGERRFAPFLQQHLPVQPGDIVTPEGEVLGHHPGAGLFTPGQRKGLGIGGRRGGDAAPWYVVEIDIGRNQVVVAQEGHPLLHRSLLELSRAHWIGNPPALPADLTACIRYRQSARPCTLEQGESGLQVRFDSPQRAPAPGQYCVFYDKERCLGGAVIAAASV